VVLIPGFAWVLDVLAEEVPWLVVVLLLAAGRFTLLVLVADDWRDVKLWLEEADALVEAVVVWLNELEGPPTPTPAGVVELVLVKDEVELDGDGHAQVNPLPPTPLSCRGLTSRRKRGPGFGEGY
jgi:hypothetical protein